MNQGEVARAFEDIRTQFTDFIRNYPIIVIIVVAIVIVLVFVNRLTPVLRVQKSVSRIQGYMNTGEIKTDIYPISYWIKQDTNSLKKNNYVDSNHILEVPTAPTATTSTAAAVGNTFADYHIMSSAKSYLVKNRHYDFCSLRVLQSILLFGAKFVELDIFNAGFSEDMLYPVVTNGYDKGEWKTCINKLSFEDCCNTVLKYGIQYWEQNWTDADPIFLYLNCHNLKIDTMNKMAEIIYRVFTEKYLPPKDYCSAKKNIMDQPPAKFYNKVIIISNIFGDNSAPRLDEMINLTSYAGKAGSKTHASQFETIPYNNNFKLTPKKLSFVYEDSPGNELVNYNPIVPWIKGAQFVGMHFQSNDPNMMQYLKMFSLQYPTSIKGKDSFVVNTSYRLKKKTT